MKYVAMVCGNNFIEFYVTLKLKGIAVILELFSWK